MRLFPLLILAACAPGLEPGFADDLTHRGGCGDVVFYAYDDADTTLLRLDTQGLVEEATEAETTITTVFELPEAAIDLRVEVGRQISDAVCDDVIENGGPTVTETWEATEGTVTITVVPGAMESDARSDLRIEDAMFEAGGDAAELELLEITDVSVGWYAG